MHAEHCLLHVPCHLGGAACSPHPHPGCRFILVVEGDVTVQTADGTVELGTNDFAYFPANFSHTWVIEPRTCCTRLHAWRQPTGTARCCCTSPSRQHHGMEHRVAEWQRQSGTCWAQRCMAVNQMQLCRSFLSMAMRILLLLSRLTNALLVGYVSPDQPSPSHQDERRLPSISCSSH
jgi:hypothetical protein